MLRKHTTRTTLLAIFLLLGMLGMAQPEIRFEKRVQKFEKVKPGPVLGFDFLYTNEGNEPLVISEIKVSCTCTKTTFPTKPVMPGQSATIHVTFDTNGKLGWQDRTLEVYSNAGNSPEKIRFKGMVDHKADRK